MQLYENTIGGFFSRLGDDMNALASDVGNAAAGVKSAWGSIKSGEAWKNIKAGAATAWEGVKGAASWVKDKAVSAWNGVKNVAASAWNSVAGAVSTAVGAVGTFAEKTGNWFSGDGFNTDDEVVDIKLARYQELINNPVLMASNGDGNQAEMFAWKSASERANEMRQIAEKITPQQLEYAILRSGMSKEDADKLRQMYSLENNAEKEIISPIKGFSKDDIVKNTDKDPQVIGEPRLGSPFGPRNGKYHYGVDFKGAGGETLVATQTGEISYGGSDDGLWGYHAILKNSEGLETIYAHMTKDSYLKGQERYKDNNTVKQGDYVGVVGNSGKYTESKTGEQKDYFTHLHFGMRVPKNNLNIF
jgi:murein DD-endopeptidase MepM/ murein hydrolase activator NlpD